MTMRIIGYTQPDVFDSVAIQARPAQDHRESRHGRGNRVRSMGAAADSQIANCLL
jgi:hypothetical protein